MMKKFITCFIVLLFLSNWVNSQNKRYCICVKDSITKKGIPYAGVAINKRLSFDTNKKGCYRFNKKISKRLSETSHLEYSTFQIKYIDKDEVQFEFNKHKRFDIYLIYDSNWVERVKEII